MPRNQPTVALYGAGMISRAHGAAARIAGFPVVAVASRQPATAAERAAELGGRVASYDQLRSGEVRADVIVVSTPPSCHTDDAIALLDTDAVVLLEKPMCTTLADADRLVAAAATRPNHLIYGENLASAPAVRTLLDLLAAAGPLRHLEVRTLQGLPTWGQFTSDEWGGGALFDLGAHAIALALLCAQAAAAGSPQSVRCTLRGGSGHSSDEWAEVHVRFESGLVARLESSWQHGPTPQWDVQAASDDTVARLELLPQVVLERNGDPLTLSPATSGLTSLEALGFLHQLRTVAAAGNPNGAVPQGADFGRDVLDITCAAYASAARDGETESLPFTGRRDRTPLELWRLGQ